LPTFDLASHAPWLESKRRSRERRAEARRARRRSRGHRTGAVLAAASLTFAVGGAVAHEKSGGTSPASVQRAGSTVAALQSALGIPADGVYGPQTRAAVKRFQRSKGLAVDGIAGPVTLGALGVSGTAATTGSATSTAPTSAPSGTLARIAACESGGNPAAVSPTGRYRGKYQFSRATWREMGGAGDPAQAPEAEQDRIAAKLLAARGTSPWPNCA
jgi:soluble lytic murein transglycosylase-like protein